VNCRQQVSFCKWAECLTVVCFLFFPGVVLAGDTVVIGGNEQQKKFISCIVEVAADDLRVASNSDEPMTVVIIEHQKFLQARGAFHAYNTVLAFSNLGTRRMYLSSRVFTDLDTAVRCITHELGHFVIRDAFEDHAELAAGRIRWRVRQACL